jgi:Ser/Thr protein kinase RdoA (MazF antagonist)
MSPRSFHLTAADAIREAMIDGHWGTWEQWDDVLEPFQKYLDGLLDDGRENRRIEALLEQAQERLEAHLSAQDALLIEALTLLGERP